tara:strand:+ start:979 stop:1608 length:630 start_codon:yes stop_codon:yes gene_type:complete
MANYLDTKQIMQLDRLTRLNLINSISGIQNVHLIATKSKKGVSNLSIINSVVHIGSNPPLLGFINRPAKNFRRDTINNLNYDPFFTINNVEKSKIKNAHLTSGKYPQNISEFKECGFKEIYIDSFPIPFVKSSNIKIGLEMVERINITLNNTILIVGLVKILQVPDDFLKNTEKYTVGSVGLNSYYSIKKLDSFKYVSIKNTNSETTKS